MEHDLNIRMIFGIKEKYNFDPYNVFLAIATNILQCLMTAFVLLSHIFKYLDVCKMLQQMFFFFCEK